jgi:hypothetical protein
LWNPRYKSQEKWFRNNKAKRKAWRKKNKAKCSKLQQEYVENHRIHIRKYQRDWCREKRYGGIQKFFSRTCRECGMLIPYEITGQRRYCDECNFVAKIYYFDPILLDQHADRRAKTPLQILIEEEENAELR